MKFINKRNLIVSSMVAVLGTLAIGGSVLALSPSTPSSNRLPSYTVKQDRLEAEAEVLGTTSQNLENSLKTEKLSQIIKSKGLTLSEFKQQVRSDVVAELEQQGYSQTQINHHLKHKKHSSKT